MIAIGFLRWHYYEWPLHSIFCKVKEDVLLFLAQIVEIRVLSCSLFWMISFSSFSASFHFLQRQNRRILHNQRVCANDYRIVLSLKGSFSYVVRTLCWNGTKRNTINSYHKWSLKSNCPNQDRCKWMFRSFSEKPTRIRLFNVRKALSTMLPFCSEVKCYEKWNKKLWPLHKNPQKRS